MNLSELEHKIINFKHSSGTIAGMFIIDYDWKILNIKFESGEARGIHVNSLRGYDPDTNTLKIDSELYLDLA